MLKTICRKN